MSFFLVPSITFRSLVCEYATTKAWAYQNADKKCIGLVVHLLGFFAIIITLLACTKKKNSAKEVFGSFENYTSYSSNGVAFLIGLLPTCTGFTAMDMPARYSEETAKPHTDVSRSMFWGVLAASAIGLPFVIVIAFCMGDPAVLLTSNIAALSPMAQVSCGYPR